ncbi:MAG: phosphatase PAP2 family protein [Gammaproteobacteria bacterium]
MTSALIALFFAGYFHVQQHPVHELTVVPLTALDELIPFQPYALIAYLSLWLYVGAGPGLQRTNQELIAYALWIGALCMAGLGIFYFWPTQLAPVTVDASNLPAFEMLRKVDSANNACPSMHVAAAVFTAIRIHDVFARVRAPMWLRALNFIWCGLIVYSTLATKQHLALDVAAGMLLGVVFGVMSLVASRRRLAVARMA